MTQYICFQQELLVLVEANNLYFSIEKTDFSYLSSQLNSHAWYMLPDSCTFVGMHPKNVKYSSPLLIYNISWFTIVLVCWPGYYPWLKRTGSSVETPCLGCNLCSSRFDVMSVDFYSVRFFLRQNCYAWLDCCK